MGTNDDDKKTPQHLTGHYDCWLPVFKQGDDLATYLSETETSADAFEALAVQYEAAVATAVRRRGGGIFMKVWFVAPLAFSLGCSPLVGSETPVEQVAVETCAPTWHENRLRYEKLTVERRTAERDASIQILEGCRQEFAAALWEKLPDIVEDNRRAYSHTFKASYMAKIEGGTLHLQGRGGQAQVESWCGEEDAGSFAKILLTEDSNTFSCVPATWRWKRERYKDLLATLGAAKPLSTEPEPRPVPVW